MGNMRTFSTPEQGGRRRKTKEWLAHWGHVSDLMLGRCCRVGTVSIGMMSAILFSCLSHSESVMSVTSTQLCHYRDRIAIFEQIVIGMVQKNIMAPP